VLTPLRPRTAQGVEGLTALLDDPQRSLIALDFDGTLAPIVEDPEQARAHPRAVPALVRLAAHVGTVAVLTGRSALDAVRYAGVSDVPELSGLVVLGHYGAQRWAAETGRLTSPPPPEEVHTARAALPDVLAAAGAPAGTHVEDKGSALGVHVRRTDDPAAALALLREPLTELAGRTGLVLEPGRMVLELRPPGMDKGAALRALVQERAARAVLFAGDDLGDLAAYAAVQTLRSEGVAGLLVCSASAEVGELAERADVVVDGPAGVVDLLEALADAFSR
jgi:trehalose 6-phosphate phosphatase